jgi:hypothetical protein
VTLSKRRVFVWKEYRRWRKVALDILKDHVDADVFAELRRNLAWLDNTVAKVKGYHPNTKALLAEGLRTRYGFLRAYHGCRPVSLAPYYEKGLLPSSPAELQIIARSIFSNSEGIEKAIVDLANDDRYSYEEHNSGKIFFCLTPEELTEDCGHYLLSGSEYLQAVAVRVNQQHVLRSRGKATLLECDIPMENIGDEWTLCLAGEILQQIGEGFLRQPLGSAGSSFGFWTAVPLLPENIVGVTHPTGIPNPHNYQIRED